MRSKSAKYLVVQTQMASYLYSYMPIQASVYYYVSFCKHQSYIEAVDANNEGWTKEKCRLCGTHTAVFSER